MGLEISLEELNEMIWCYVEVKNQLRRDMTPAAYHTKIIEQGDNLADKVYSRIKSIHHLNFKNGSSVTVVRLVCGIV